MLNHQIFKEDLNNKQTPKYQELEIEINDEFFEEPLRSK